MKTHEGREARRRLVVKGILRIVVVYLEIVSFWKIIMGRTPACSEPCVGSRFAIQISPRLTVIANPHVLGVLHIRSFRVPQVVGLLRQIRCRVWLSYFHLLLD